jgi:hypothetical protein
MTAKKPRKSSDDAPKFEANTRIIWDKRESDQDDSSNKSISPAHARIKSESNTDIKS